MLIPGGPGIGKTRFAHELQFPCRIPPNMSAEFKSAFSKPLYIYLDLNNGLQYEYLFDSKYDASIRLGVRLASHYFASSTPFVQFLKLSDDSLNQFEFYSVLRYVVQQERLSRDANEVIPIILHIDEYQLYIDAASTTGELGQKKARCFFKEMLHHIGIFMISSQYHDLNVCLLPICTGTSSYDVTFLPTEYNRTLIKLPPLSAEHAQAMAQEHYAENWSRISTSNAFQVALSDTGSSHLLCLFFYVAFLSLTCRLCSSICGLCAECS